MIVLANQVAQFHREFGHPVNEHPSNVSIQDLRLRIKLVIEELCELVDGLNTDDPLMWSNLRYHLKSAHDGCDALEPAKIDSLATLDAIADLSYVITGLGLSLGLPLVQAVDEVHKSNMSKLGPNGQAIFGADGKIKKGSNYKPPDLAQFLSGNGNRFLSAWDAVLHPKGPTNE